MNIHKLCQYFNCMYKLYSSYLYEIDIKDTEIYPKFKKCTLSSFISSLKKRFEENFNLINFLHENYDKKDDEYTKIYDNMINPSKFNEALDNLNIKEYDILDLEDYRGSGYYFVFKENNVLMIEKTLGEYGYYLPYEGHKLIKKLNLKSNDYFIDQNIEIFGFHLPVGTEVVQLDLNSKYCVNHNDSFFDLSYHESEGSYYLINGQKFFGVLI